MPLSPAEIAEKLQAEEDVRRHVKVILWTLSFRGVEISDAVRDRVAACTDPETLREWVGRSPAVARAEDIFTEIGVDSAASAQAFLFALAMMSEASRRSGAGGSFMDVPKHLEASARSLAESQARGVIRILGFRGVEVSDAVRERITGCTD
jgi:hypothetical protein